MCQTTRDALAVQITELDHRIEVLRSTRTLIKNLLENQPAS
ncbi:hypothetical protein [Propionibacterium sp.]